MNKTTFICAICAIALAGCGGGGGSSISVATNSGSLGVVINPSNDLRDKTANFTLGNRLYKSSDLALADGARVYADSVSELSTPKGWNLGLMGAGLVAALIDSGIDYNIAPNMEGYYTYSNSANLWPDIRTRLSGNALVHHEYAHPLVNDPQCKNISGTTGFCDHGRRVAAVINKLLPEAKFANITSVNYNAQGDEISTAASLDAFSLKGLRFINRSLGSSDDITVPDAGDFLLATAYKNAIVVSAAGNEETHGLITSNALEPNSPLKPGWIIALGYGDYRAVINGVDQEQKYYVEQNGQRFYVYPRGDTCKAFGADDCIAAPYTVYINDPHIKYGSNVRLDGTSFSTPIVLASAMAVYAKYPWMSNDNIKETLFSTAYEVKGGSAAQRQKHFGVGILNAASAMHGPAKFRHDFIADVDEGLYVFSNDISGLGGLVKNGPGTLALTGFNTFSGEMINTQGVLWLTNANAANVSNNALLRLSKAKVGSLDNSGTIISEGFNARNLFLDKNSSIYMNLNDPINVENKAKLAGKLNVVGDIYLKRNEISNVRVISAGELSGRFDDIKSSSAFLKIDDALYSTKGLDLVLSSDNKLINLASIDAYAAKNYEKLFDRFDYLAREKAAGFSAEIGSIAMSDEQQRGAYGAEVFAAGLEYMNTKDAVAMAPILFGSRAGELAASNLAGIRSMQDMVINTQASGISAAYLHTKTYDESYDIAATKFSLVHEHNWAPYTGYASFIIGGGNASSTLGALAIGASTDINFLRLRADLMYGKINSELDSSALAASISARYLHELNANLNAKFIADARFISLKNKAITLGLANVFANRFNQTSESFKAGIDYLDDKFSLEAALGIRLNQSNKRTYFADAYGALVENEAKLTPKASALVQLRLNYLINDKASVGLLFDTEFAKNYFINQASFGFNYQF